MNNYLLSFPKAVRKTPKLCKITIFRTKKKLASKSTMLRNSVIAVKTTIKEEYIDIIEILPSYNNKKIKWSSAIHIKTFDLYRQ